MDSACLKTPNTTLIFTKLLLYERFGTSCLTLLIVANKTENNVSDQVSISGPLVSEAKNLALSHAHIMFMFEIMHETDNK